MTSRFCFLCLINIYLKRLLVETTPQRNIIHTNSFTQLSALESLFRFSRAINFSVLAHSRYFHQPHFQQMFPADMLWQTLHMPSAKHQPVEKKKPQSHFFFYPYLLFLSANLPLKMELQGLVAEIFLCELGKPSNTLISFSYWCLCTTTSATGQLWWFLLGNHDNLVTWDDHKAVCHVWWRKKSTDHPCFLSSHQIKKENYFINPPLIALKYPRHVCTVIRAATQSSSTSLRDLS